jgi:putative DNA primase/helicase
MDDQVDREYWFEDTGSIVDADANASAIQRFNTICVNDFMELELPARTMVLDPILPTGGLGMLFAGRGIGKTHVALGIAWAIATGGSFLRWRAPIPRHVLYIDGEMPQQSLQDRLNGIKNADEHVPDDGAFRLLCMDRQQLGSSLNLADKKHQEIVDLQLDDVEFLVLDNMSTLMNGGPENDAESWISMQAWLLQLRRRGITVLVVHHASRNGNARGTSKREDVLDTIIQLKRPEDYDSTEGARFEVHLTKARGVFGAAAEAFEASLTDGEAGVSVWSCRGLTDGDEEDMRSVLELSESGKTIRAIAHELQIPKTVIHRLLQKAKRLKAETADRT